VVATSGLKLNFSEDGEVKVKKGEKQLPHRSELVREAFEKGDYLKVCDMAWNFNTRGCKNGSTLEQLDIEYELLMKARDICTDRLLEEIDRLPEVLGLTSEKAA